LSNSRPQHGGGYAHDYNYMMAHDGQRDNLKEFGEVKKEIVVNRYEAAKEIAAAQFENYKATTESEKAILLRIDDMERRQSDREFARQAAENASLRTMLTVRTGGWWDGCAAG
jgi:hypothetical protein